MTILTANENTGKTITDGGVTASRVSFINKSQKTIITGKVLWSPKSIHCANSGTYASDISTLWMSNPKTTFRYLILTDDSNSRLLLRSSHFHNSYKLLNIISRYHSGLDPYGLCTIQNFIIVHYFLFRPFRLYLITFSKIFES